MDTFVLRKFPFCLVPLKYDLLSFRFWHNWQLRNSHSWVFHYRLQQGLEMSNHMTNKGRMKQVCVVFK